MVKQLPEEYKGKPVSKTGIKRNQYEIIEETYYMLIWRFGPKFVLDRYSSVYNDITGRWETQQAYKPSTNIRGSKFIHLQNCLDRIEQLKNNPDITLIKMITISPEFEWEKEE